MAKTAYEEVVEGAVVARVPVVKKVSREMEVFYNPVMKLNRDVSVLLLHVMSEELRSKTKRFTIGSPLAGTGIREARFMVELDGVDEIAINDYTEEAVALIKENVKANEKKAVCKNVSVSCNEASKFLLDSYGFTYIDLDPFGTPCPFLDAAVKRLQRGGVLGVTATDTSALSGTYEGACKRKYWSKPLRNHLMHEVGLRILVRKVQLVAAQYEKALRPIYSYSKDHYMRVFFRCEKGRRRVDALLGEHRFLHHCTLCLKTLFARENNGECCGKELLVAGPLWAGALWDVVLAERMVLENESWEYGQVENQKFLELVAEEAKAPARTVGFFPFNLVRKTLKRDPLTKKELLGGKNVFPTHFVANAVKAESVEALFKK